MKKLPRKPASIKPAQNSDNNNIPDIKLPVDLDEKLQLLKPYIEKSVDIMSLPFYVDSEFKLQVQAVYINGVVNEDFFNQHILRPLMLNTDNIDLQDSGVENLADIIYHTSVTVGKVQKIDKFADLVQNIYDGMLVLMFDTLEEVLLIDIHGGEHREITEPPSEKTLYGAREGFIENLDVNISLIRNRLGDPRLVVQKTVVGKRMHTQIAIAYIEDIADP